jgi:hypothetical protein
MNKAVPGTLVRDQHMILHMSGCERIGWESLNVSPFTWAEGRSKGELERYVSEGSRCRSCRPIESVFGSMGIFYAPDGGVIGEEHARWLISNHDERMLVTTRLEFLGHALQVVSTFVPVDHGDTHGRYTESPACWVTEIIGGPPEMDGTSRYSRSKESCLAFHEEVVDMALAAGCIEVDW